MPRPTPFELVFEPVAPTTFPPIRSALDHARQDPHDRDSFLMLQEAVALLRDLRPEEGLGEGMDQLAALVHHAYLFWAAGSLSVAVSLERLERLLDERLLSSGDHKAVPPYYVQMPERRIWADVVPGQPHEPLDGCFVHLDSDGGLRVLGVFGVHAERPGFSVVEVMGPRSLVLVRADGSRLFAPTLPGGAAAHLFSLAGAEELLELGWRTQEIAAESSMEAALWKA